MKLEGNVKDDCLASFGAVYFLGCGDVKITKRRLEVGGGHLKVEKFLCDRSLELIRFSLFV